MNREHIYRGLSIDGSKWHTGNFFYWIKYGVKISIIGDGVQNGSVIGFEVQPDTVTQFTGLKDKNGVGIYEGDIVKGGIDERKIEISEIEFKHGSFRVKAEFFGYEGEGLWDWDEIEVIGDIYQTPNLISL